ncbi:MAG TPA: GDSL-type esterase/lipase family protein [Pirellulaceae bacterium]|nr:GDSL-type esterase/lipase family protein [Pirellulaceae bacterium]
MLLAFGGTSLGEEGQLPRTHEALESGQPVTIVCFGDSVTGVYYHTGGRRAYTGMLGIALKKAYPQADLAMINAGVSGHATTNALERIERDVLKHKPTLVTVMFGLNDMVRVPLEDYRANLNKIIDQCQAAGAEVLLCTPNNVITTSGRPTEKLVTYCDAIRAVGKDRGIPVCDIYAALEALRSEDALAWRLLLSDEIHPNMHGHKRMAEIIAKSISGKDVSLADVPPPTPALVKTTRLVKEKMPVKVLAMPPLDASIGAALQEATGGTQFEVIPWPVEGKSLPEIEKDAQARVRRLKPDLVVIAVPRNVTADSPEQFIRSYAWIMNWSLSFGTAEWDCVVIHPSVIEPDKTGERDGLVRQLVRSQDLTLIDRGKGDKRPPSEIVVEALKD